MDKEEIEKKVKEILSKKLTFPIERIRLEMSLEEDLGVDSFGAIEIIFGLEDTFNINISEEQMASIKTVNDIVAYLYKRLESEKTSN